MNTIISGQYTPPPPLTEEQKMRFPALKDAFLLNSSKPFTIPYPKECFASEPLVAKICDVKRGDGKFKLDGQFQDFGLRTVLFRGEQYLLGITKQARLTKKGWFCLFPTACNPDTIAKVVIVRAELEDWIFLTEDELNNFLYCLIKKASTAPAPKAPLQFTPFQPLVPFTPVNQPIKPYSADNK